jgi:hypothetical protein
MTLMLFAAELSAQNRAQLAVPGDVEVTSDRPEWFDHAGNFHTDALRVVERYTRS